MTKTFTIALLVCLLATSARSTGSDRHHRGPCHRQHRGRPARRRGRRHATRHRHRQGVGQRRRRLLSCAVAAGGTVSRTGDSAAVRAGRAGTGAGQRQRDDPRAGATRARIGGRDSHRRGWRVTRGRVVQCAGSRGHRAGTRGPAAQRTELHAARSAPDRRRPADGWHRDRRRHASSGSGVRRERHAARAERLPGGRRPQRQPDGRRLRAAPAGGCHRRVPHPVAECAARVRWHGGRHDQRRHEVGRQPVSRQPLRVPPQRCLRRPQLLLA